MRPTHHVAPEDTVQRAVGELRRNGGVVPVAKDDFLHGIVTERALGEALGYGVDLNAPTSSIMVDAETIAPYASGAEALRRLSEGDGLPLVVVDDLGRVLGLLGPSDLYPHRRPAPRPSMVGGMATPFGVYLTSGALAAGAKGLRLMTTGIAMFTMLQVSNIVTAPLVGWLAKMHVDAQANTLIVTALTVALFLLTMRLVPLSGTHGAEHQVVHALERGEDLTPDVVRRMPRVHPRCGTNVAAAATLFLSIWQTPWVKYEELRFVAALVLTLAFWRPIGSWLQQHVTTKPPTDAQLRGAIRAAEELLDRYARSRVASPSPFQRIWNSGMLHVIAGSSLAGLLLWGFGRLFHIDVGLE